MYLILSSDCRIGSVATEATRYTAVSSNECLHFTLPSDIDVDEQEQRHAFWRFDNKPTNCTPSAIHEPINARTMLRHFCLVTNIFINQKDCGQTRGGIALENRVQAVGRSRASPLRSKVLSYTANPAIKSVLLCVEKNE